MDPQKNLVSFVMLGVSSAVVCVLASIDIFSHWTGAFWYAGFGPIATIGFILALLWRAWNGSRPLINWAAHAFLVVAIASFILGGVLIASLHTAAAASVR